MTKAEDLMRLVDSLADAAFATGQAQAGIRPVCVLPDTKHLRRRIEHALIPLCTELEVLRYRELAEENAHLREESLRQPVNGPGTAVDSRSAARSSSLGSHSQPSGIVSSGVLAPSRATHTDTIIGLCNRCCGQVADACDVIGYRRPAPTCLRCKATAPQPTQIRKSMFGTLVMMGDPPVDEVWAEDFWRKGKP